MDSDVYSSRLAIHSNLHILDKTSASLEDLTQFVESVFFLLDTEGR